MKTNLEPSDNFRTDKSDIYCTKHKSHPINLQISVDDVISMQITQRRNDLGAIKSCLFFWKYLQFRQMIKQFAANDILHDKTETVVSLERVRQMLNNEKTREQYVTTTNSTSLCQNNQLNLSVFITLESA